MLYENKTITHSPDYIIKRLNDSIEFVCQNISCYCASPHNNFTRKRKLPADTLMRFLIQMQSKSSVCELNDYFLDFNSLPSSSALVQQRHKLNYSALKRVMDLFTQSQDNFSTYKGYFILAQDGSDLNIPFLNDETVYKSKNNFKPYCQYHLNALYDCLNHVFYDVNIDLPSKKQEAASLINIISHSNYPVNSIITADRGYENYNLMACCIENKQKFVIRIKDITSKNGILSNVLLPDGEFDVSIKKTLTRKQTKEIKADKDKYTFVPSTSQFDYLKIEDEFYKMDLRVVRFKITDDTYECIVTNLSEDEFSLEELKELYRLRWCEEVGFRMLKYTVGAVYFHSKNREFIKQEIYANLIMHNLCSIITFNIEIEQNAKLKHIKKTNFAVAVTNIRNYLKNMIDSKEIIVRIKKFLVPIRPERSFKRSMKAQSAKSLNHRIA